MSSVRLDQEKLDYKLRRMLPADLSTVLSNERVSYTHPWTEGTFSDCLKSGYECWLVTVAGNVVGHGILSVAAGESHLLNACVKPAWQGRGLGRVLVEHLLLRAENRNSRRVFLEVRPSNQIAYKLYETLGFNEIGLRENYYPAFVGREDALVLAREIIRE